MNKKYILMIALFILIIIVIAIVAFNSDKKLSEDSFQENDFLVDKNVDNGSPEQAYLKSVNTEGFGTARRTFVDGKFLHTISANLPPLTDEVYIGWLMEPKTGRYIKTGRLIYLDNELFLFFQSDSNLPNYKRAIITKHQDETASAPGDIQLEGYF